MNVINLTAHTINDTTSGKSYPKSGLVLRAKCSTTQIKAYGDLYVCEYNTVLETELPKQLEDTVYIVSNMAMGVIPKNRKDILSPGPVEKDENGKIIGCRGFRINN